MQQTETMLGQWLKKQHQRAANINTSRDNLYSDEELAILKEGLAYEKVALDDGILENSAYMFDVHSFIRNYQICKGCRDAVECNAPSKGYCSTLGHDGRLLLRQCNKYVNYRRAFKQVLMASNAQIPIGYKEMTFQNLDPTGNERAFEYAKALAINATQKGMFLYGGTGCGKTHLAVATLQEWVKHSGGMFFTLPNLLSLLRDNIRNKEQLDKIMDNVLSTELLVIDDMGTEKFSDWVGERMFQIINDRIINRRKLIITSNFSMEQLEARMEEQGGRIMSRIAGMCTVFKVTGRDRRLD